MSTIVRATVVALTTFATGLLGLWVQSFLPAQVLSDGKGMVGSIVGLVTLLLALVLGLLVWTSYGVYTTQVSESQSLGPVVLQLGFALERYKQEARRGRDLLYQLVLRSRERFWPALYRPFSHFSDRGRRPHSDDRRSGAEGRTGA